MPISKVQRLVLCVLTAIGVWLASVFIAECAFRLLGDRASAEMKGLYTAFGDGSYKLRPNATTGANWASGRFTVTTDDLGLRCDPTKALACRPGDKLDALVIGDSQGFGNGVGFESTIPGRLAIEARTAGLRIANASVGGHVGRNQLELVRWLVEQQQVQVANYILLFTPSMTVSCDGYTRASVGEDGRLYDRPKTSAERAIIYLKSNAVTYARLRNAIRNFGIGNQASSSSEFLFYLFGHGLDEQRVQSNLKDYLVQFNEFAGGHHARVWLVYVPLTVEVEFESVAEAARAQGIAVDRDLPLRSCTSVAAALNLPLRSLRPVLEQVKAEGAELHLKGDYHYSDKASIAAGTDVWSWLAGSLSTPAAHGELSQAPLNYDIGNRSGNR